MKKILAILMSLAMVLCMMPAVAFGADQKGNGSDKAIKVEYEGDDGTVTEYFDYFGKEDGVNIYLLKKVPAGKDITITLQKDVTGIAGGFALSQENGAEDFFKLKIEGFDPESFYLYIPSGRTVLLNLNGHKLEGEMTEDDGVLMWRCLIANAGKLEIIGNKGQLVNNGEYGSCIYSNKLTWPIDGSKPTLSISDVEFIQTEPAADSMGTCGAGVITAIETDISEIKDCTFKGNGYDGSIYVKGGASVNKIKGCSFENVKSALFVESDSGENGVMVSLVEECVVTATFRAIYFYGHSPSSGKIGTLKNCTLTSEEIAIQEGVIEEIYGGTIKGSKDSYNESIGAGVINGTRVSKITGNAVIEGENLAAVTFDGGKCVIESGILKSTTPYAVVMRSNSSDTGKLNINGGTYIGTGESPLSVPADDTITYPFGKKLNEESADTFTLNYNAEKIVEDTQKALEEITLANDSDKKDLANKLQENINSISDESLREIAQKQADSTIKKINGTVTVTLVDGTAETTMEVAKDSIPAIAAPTKAGYTFDGWYTDKELKTPYNAAATDKDLTLYAKWTANSTGGYYPPTPTTQKPVIEADDNVVVTLSDYGTKATIKAADGYELVDVTVNGVSKGKVDTLTGLKTGDKVVVTTKKIVTIEDEIAAVKAVKLVARSANAKAPSGKKAIKVYWFSKDGSELNFDGYEIYRSTKKNKFGKKPIFTSKTTKYFNTSAKKGTRYYYKVRGFKVIGGEKIYTDFSLKAIRTAK